MDKPTTAEGYSPDMTRHARATCLYVATKLGDLMDEMVVVGRLVPSLLITEDELADASAMHVGTMDLDVGLNIELLSDGLYRTLTERRRNAGFQQDLNVRGNETRQRWRLAASGSVSVDFLIEPSRPDDRGGQLRNIEPDFAAVIVPGLHLAFQDWIRVTISDDTVFRKRATRQIKVCGRQRSSSSRLSHSSTAARTRTPTMCTT